MLGSMEASGSEMDVRLLEQNSTIIIARESGEVIQKLVNVNDLVKSGDKIVALANPTGTIDIRSNSDGKLSKFSDAIEKGATVQQGDFVAELLSRDINGVLIPKSSSPFESNVKADESYCCLYIGDQRLDVKILNVVKSGNIESYYFSTQTDGKIESGNSENRENEEMEVKFKLEDKS